MKKITVSLTQRLFGLALIAALILAGCNATNGTPAAPTAASPAVSRSDNTVIVEGRVTPRDSAQLFFAAGGIVAEITVAEGEQVKKGQVLARLSEREPLEAALAAAQLELTAAQQSLDDLKEKADLAYQQALAELAAARLADTQARQKLADLDTDSYQDKIDDARQEVTDAKEKLDDAQDEFDKYKDLDPDNTNRKRAEDDLKDAQRDYDQAVRDLELLLNALEQAKVQVSLSQSRLEDLQRRVEELKDGPDPDALALAEARLTNAQKQVLAAQSNLDKLELKAPFDGTVVKIDIAEGERAVPNQPVMLLADFSAWYVDTTDLTEKEVVQIALGQAAKIIPDALPEVEMSGEVASISDAFALIAGDVTYTVRLLLPDPDPRLRWGMTVEVRFAAISK